MMTRTICLIMADSDEIGENDADPIRGRKSL